MGPERILFLLILILVIVIIWRGPKTLPLIGRAFGQGVKEARREMNEIKADMEKKPDEGTGTSGTGSTPGTPGTPGGTPPA